MAQIHPTLLGSPMILPLSAKLGSSQNEILIDDLDGDGADDILVVRVSADGRLAFAEFRAGSTA